MLPSVAAWLGVREQNAYGIAKVIEQVRGGTVLLCGKGKRGAPGGAEGKQFLGSCVDG
jgi:hypothetical protein